MSVFVVIRNLFGCQIYVVSYFVQILFVLISLSALIGIFSISSTRSLQHVVLFIRIASIPDEPQGVPFESTYVNFEGSVYFIY